jgi:hypothetical protein
MTGGADGIGQAWSKRGRWPPSGTAAGRTGRPPVRTAATAETFLN